MKHYLNLLPVLLVMSASAFAAKPDFSWVLGDVVDTNEFATDKRSKEVLNAVVPQAQENGKFAQSLKETVRLNVWVGDKAVKDSRYVTFTGFRAHDAGSHGILWLDVKDGIGFFAINSCYYRFTENDCYTIGSRHLGADKLPSIFLEELKKWLKEEKTIKPLRFIGADGKAVDYKLP